MAGAVTPASTSTKNPGMVSLVRRWVVTNFASSSWLLLAPLLAAYASRRRLMFLTYFHLHLRRIAQCLLNAVDPTVSLDIFECPIVEHVTSLHPMAFNDTTYEEVKAYLSATCLVISMRDGKDVTDEFRGATLWWSSVVEKDHQSHGGSYMSKPWSYVNFDHPTTFETLVMEPTKKKEIMDDLDEFRNSRDFYRRASKPWKRGYLLYGPPGTGKSTMIAAMANHLKYVIYDVELTMVRNNNDLRKLLVETTSKSIVIIEDIDCSLDLTANWAMK
ncbi:hypothetical protein HU200_015967 [Digitaria exilis]|uniref:ATPase AAA-type core domain-containing protein n=1 Tax=Digitaria exilis TaxID=1010633 RepID=A0A835KLG9_9POAL|nr:hypothetical protein HU200_015967 [Digitaria exilis]